MPEKDVNSPVNTRHPASKLSSNLPLSPGARSDPGRGDQATGREPEPPLHERVMQGADQPAELKTTEPAEPARGDSVPLGQSMMDYYLQRSTYPGTPFFEAPDNARLTEKTPRWHQSRTGAASLLAANLYA